MYGREEQCKRILLKINGSVEGYNVDLEYSRMCQEISNAAATKTIQSGGSYLEVFKGTNLVRNNSVRSQRLPPD
jgi:glutamine amidotransferase-like uncharacterized protein